MNQSLLNEEDLKAWLGYEQRAAVERWLSERGIQYDKSQDKIVTTVQAVNNALIGITDDSKGFEFG